MAAVNIGGDINDASYRYKMPALIAKVEGRGNGIKTVIVNMVDIAKALHTDPAYPTKFFGMELGAQSTFNRNTERAIVNGSHRAADLAVVLTKFIETFILCPGCHLPEIKMSVKKSNIKIDCAACGHNSVLKTAHKLATYIVKNPPGGDKKSKKDKKKKKDRKKKSRKERDAEQAAAAAAAAASAADAADATTEQKKPAKEKEEKPKKEKSKKKEEVEWFTDTSVEATEARKAAELEEMKASKAVETIMKAATDLKKESPESLLRMFLARDRTVVELTAEVKRLQLSRGLDDSQKVQVLVHAIVDPDQPKKVPGQFKQNAKYLKEYAKDQQEAMILLGAIEELIGKTHKSLIKLAPHILQALYESDVLEEEQIIAWYESPPEASWLVSKEVAASVRNKSTKFVDWLRSAESESDDDSDNE